MMLQSLTSLSDDEIESVTYSVREGCRLRHCEIDNLEGGRALTASIDLVQSKHNAECLAAKISHRLDSSPDTHAG